MLGPRGHYSFFFMPEVTLLPPKGWRPFLQESRFLASSASAAASVWVKHMPKHKLYTQTDSEVADGIARMLSAAPARIALSRGQRCALVELRDEQTVTKLLHQHEHAPLSMGGDVVRIERAHCTDEAAVEVEAVVKNLIRQLEARDAAVRRLDAWKRRRRQLHRAAPGSTPRRPHAKEQLDPSAESLRPVTAGSWSSNARCSCRMLTCTGDGLGECVSALLCYRVVSLGKGVLAEGIDVGS